MAHSLMKKHHQGFTLLEVIIALFVFTLGILGVAAMQLRSIHGNASGMRLTEATAQAQDIIETIMQEPYISFITPVPPSPNPAPLGTPITTTTTVGQYTVTRNIAVIPGAISFTANDAILVTVNVAWTEAGANGRNTQISFIKSRNMETSYEEP